MLSDGTSQSDHIGFLKSVSADISGIHLTTDDYNRDAIHSGIGNSSDRVGGARTGSYQTDTDFAGSASISIRGVSRTLFMAG